MTIFQFLPSLENDPFGPTCPMGMKIEIEHLKACVETGDREVLRLRAALQKIVLMAENGDYGIAALAKEALCSTQ